MHRHLHSIINGTWLIREADAQAYIPYVLGVLRGTTAPVDRAELAERRKGLEPRMVAANTEEGDDAAQEPLEPQGAGNVMILPLNGVVVKDGGMCNYGMTDYARWLQQADQDPDVAGVVLDLDTPGGQSTGMFLMRDAIKHTKKPVVAIVRSGMAASAGMGILAACTEAYASRPTDEFGSIGAYSTLYNINKYLAKEGLDVHEIYATKSTRKNANYKEALKADPNDPDDKHYKAWREEELDPLVANFIETVKADRPAMAKTQSKWDAGQMFQADEAIALGLVDGYNTLEGAVLRVRELAKARNATDTATHTEATNPQATPAQPTNTMNLKDKLTAFAGGIKNLFTTNEEVTAETIEAANAALAEQGLQDLKVVRTSQLEAISTTEQQVADATAKTEAAEAKLAQMELDLKACLEELANTKEELVERTNAMELANASVADLKTQVDTLTTEVSAKAETIAKLENQPAEDGQPAGITTKAPGDTDPAHASEEEKQKAAFQARVKEGLKNIA